MGEALLFIYIGLYWSDCVVKYMLYNLYDNSVF